MLLINLKLQFTVCLMLYYHIRFKFYAEVTKQNERSGIIPKKNGFVS